MYDYIHFILKIFCIFIIVLIINVNIFRVKKKIEGKKIEREI